jgi:hypothetical protein
VSQEEWEAGEAPVGRDENQLMSFGTCLAPKMSLVGMEAHRDRTMGWPLGYYSYSVWGARKDRMRARVAYSERDRGQSP